MSLEYAFVLLMSLISLLVPIMAWLLLKRKFTWNNTAFANIVLAVYILTLFVLGLFGSAVYKQFYSDCNDCYQVSGLGFALSSVPIYVSYLSIALVYDIRWIIRKIRKRDNKA